MFSKATVKFLRDLARNNESEWFRTHRDVYVAEVQRPALEFAGELLAECGKRGLPFQGEPKKCLFRQNRDVRFSKNKEPYKTHVGIVFTPTGEKNAFGLGYLHIDPKESFLAGGFYMPEPPDLKRFRLAIAQKSEEFLAAVKAVERAKFEMGADGQALKKIPQGFSRYADSPVADFLRWKSFTAQTPVTHEQLFSPKLAREMAAKLEKLMPLLNFGWKHVAPPRKARG